jgi:His-Xaa-Ser system protein HxsD
MASMTAEFEVDGNVYRLAAVKKAAYKFAGSCFVEVDQPEQGAIRIRLRAKGDSQLPPDIASEFQNEVLDQELRESVADETKSVRDLLLAHAFSQTSLIDRAGEVADYVDDPLGIRQPEASA